MKVRPDTPVGRLALGIAGWALRVLLTVLSWTWRIRIVEGARHLDAVVARSEPVILSFWHNRSVMAVPFLKDRLHRAGRPVSLLASASRDGELVTRAVAPWGLHVVRGSATRGGREALWGVYRALRRLGASPVVIPDGPHGPPYVYKVGVLHLARLSAAPILPMAFASDRYWTIRSWDRLMVPRPFARISVGLAAPQRIPRDLDDVEIETERVGQEQLLTGITAEVESAAGEPGSLPLPDVTGSR
jgi:lysophospholipid acyltransferase (LPLAT)-like uncharacterized protein